jgi:hypothetical protein
MLKKKLNEIEIEKKCLRKITRRFFFNYKKGGDHEEHTEKQLKTIKLKLLK